MTPSMTFDETLIQTLDMLRRQGKVSYRALKRQFDIDDAYLDDLKFEIVEVHRAAVDQDRIMLVWTGSAADPLPPLPAAVRADPAVPAPPPRPAAEAERRHLTVMFCDLVGSTALSERLDPEDVREILNIYHDVTQKAIAGYEGFMAKYMGDGLLIYFGYPQAHEDDAMRAVRSGLRIIEAVRGISAQFEERWGVRIGVRLGVHTGMVVAGEMGAGEVRETLAIVGETPNIAARLQEVAESNSLVISAATYRLLAGNFECSSLGACALKGLSEPLLVYQVLQENSARTRLDADAEGNLIPLVGREPEMALLEHSWRLACSGHSQTVLLCGEPGIGKSRLVWEMKRKASEEPGAWLTECHASQYHRNSAFSPIIDLLERTVLQFERHATSAEKLAKVEGFLLEYGLDLAANVPLFAALLSIPFEESYAPLGLSPDRQRQKTLDTLAAIILARSARQPVLVVVEDLHWVDASTLDLIDILLRQEPKYRFLLLLTCRPEFTPPWGDPPHCTTLPLKNLLQEQTAEIVERILGGKTLPKEVMRQIVEKTDGIPLFVEELTKTVLESGLLVEKAHRFELAGALPALAIPSTLHDSLIARLDRLSLVKEVAQLGATLAREFDYELIAAVSPWDAAALQDGLAQLVQAEMLCQTGVPPNAIYKFKHALIQDAAYESLLKSRRLQYHLLIAQALEEKFPEIVETQPEQLAHHYTMASLAAAAAPYWIKAGQRALARAANIDAIAHLTRALEQVKSLPAGIARDTLELDVQIGLAPAYMAIQGWASAEVERACLRARDLSELAGDEQKRVIALWGLWSNYFLRGQQDSGIAVANDVFQLTQNVGGGMFHAPAHHAVGYTRYYRGEYTQALEVAQQGMARFDLELERALTVVYQLSSSCSILSFYAGSLWMLGYPEQAEARMAEMIALSAQLNHPPNSAYVLAACCFYQQLTGNLEGMEEKSETLKRLCREEGFVMWEAIGLMYHGWAVGMRGYREGSKAALEMGLAEAQEGVALFRTTGTGITMPQFMTMLGELLWRAEQPDAALDALEEGLVWAERGSERQMASTLYRMQAQILMQQASECGEPEAAQTRTSQAKTSFERSREIARHQNALMLELQTCAALCRVCAGSPEQEEAYAELKTLYGRFTEGLEIPILVAARALLEAHGPTCAEKEQE